MAEIVLYDREIEKWAKRRKRITKLYKDERSSAEEKAARFNILWSNTQTLLPALYARNPKPDIQRRFKDADPIGRVSSDILERCAAYFCQTDHFASTIRQSVFDYLVPGRGAIWLRYVPHFKPVEEVTDDTPDEEDGEDEGEQAQEPLETIAYEEVVPDFVHVDDFGHNVCRTWEEVWCIWRKVYMDRAALIKRFPDRGAEVPLDYQDKNKKTDITDAKTGKATIYELWDKKRGQAIWFHKDIPQALDRRHDPLELDGFFPTPKPLFANLANDSLVPTPFYIEYQDQAMELDSLTGRISMLTKALKVAGVYDASAAGLDRLLSEGAENKLIPVENWAMFAEKGGISGVISFLPIKEVADALQALYAARQQVKADLYEITGIADVVRGQSDPNETAAAQDIKSNFATQRISDHQREVQRFVRETIRIMVDIICGHFQLETIKQVSGVRLFTQEEKMRAQAAIQPSQQPGVPPPQMPAGVTPDQLQQLMDDPTWEEVEALIRNDALRCFRIDIETDSTIKSDEESDKASRIEFLKAAGGFMQQAVQAGQSSPELVPLLTQMLMFGIRGFPVGKELEGVFASTFQKLERQAQNPQPKPDPEMLKAQGQMQIEQQKVQSQQQLDQAKIQGEMQLAQAKMQAEMQLEQARIQAKRDSDMSEVQQQAAISQHENELEDARERHKFEIQMALEREKAANEANLKLQIAHIDAAAKIEVARITAKTDDGAEAEDREVAKEGA